MQRILMVCDKFPPFNASGSARPFYFAKYLPDHGYAPTVLSATLSHSDDRDDALLLELPKEVQIFRSPRIVTPSFGRVSKLVRGRPRTQRSPKPRPGGGAAARADTWTRFGGRAQYLRWWLHWEVDWGVSATLVGALRARRQPPALVWVTGPHFRSFEIGRRLARWFEVPLIVDLRDPWTYGSLWSPKTERIARAERARAARTLSAADRVIFTSPLTQQAMSRQFPELASERWLTITNGYDDVTVEPLRGVPEGRCLFRYVGALNERRTPDVLIEAFRLAAQSEEFRESALLEFIGDTGGHASKAELAHGCEVRFRGRVSRSESLKYIFGSDVNILLQTIGEGQDVVSGKAFEYLHAGKPILAVVDESGGDAWLMRETGAGVLVPWKDPAAIAERMRSAWQGWRSGSVSARPDSEKANQYSRRRLTAKLAQVFDEVLAERR